MANMCTPYYRSVHMRRSVYLVQKEDRYQSTGNQSVLNYIYKWAYQTTSLKLRIIVFWHKTAASSSANIYVQ